METVRGDSIANSPFVLSTGEAFSVRDDDDRPRSKHLSCDRRDRGCTRFGRRFLKQRSAGFTANGEAKGEFLSDN